MPMRAEMIGVPAAARGGIGGTGTFGIAAAGSTQTDATPVYDDVNAVTTTALGAGVVLRANLEPGDSQTVANMGANALLVYPPLLGQINNQPVNAPVCLLPTVSATFICVANPATGLDFVIT